MQVKSIAECSILQYFRPLLSYHLPLIPSFCLFLSGRLRQVLLYRQVEASFLLIFNQTTGTSPVFTVVKQLRCHIVKLDWSQ